MSLNETCFPIDPQDILPDGTPCIQGFCNKVKFGISLFLSSNGYLMFFLNLEKNQN